MVNFFPEEFKKDGTRNIMKRRGVLNGDIKSNIIEHEIK